MTPEPFDADACILAVDDEEGNLVLLRTMLRAAGYRRVETVQRSAEAIDRFDELRPDLVLLDLHMPAPDGFAVMEAVLRRVGADEFLPILVLSAEVNQEVRERALAEGASDLVAKPLQLSEVLLRIRNLLERRRRHQQLWASHATATAELAERRDLEHAETTRLEAIRDRVSKVLIAGGPTIVYQAIIELPLGDGHTEPRLVLDLRDQGRPNLTGPMSPVGVEALSRFNTKPSQGPDRWFHEAAEVQLLLDLELSAVSGALDALDTLPPGLFVSVNASWTTIVAEPFHEMLEACDGSRIVVELTEHERVTDYSRLHESVKRMHGRGTRLAVDDAGAGFASLDHILRLGPDIVKLDRNLVTGVDHDPIRRSMIAAFVHFGNETGIALIAEGIECDGELDTLCRLGVRHGQGYRLAVPTDLAAAMATVNLA